MQELILLLTRCLCNYTCNKNRMKATKFHFKGYYKGQKISLIEADHGPEITFEKSEDYLLWVKLLTIKDGVLGVEVLKHKKID